MTTSSAKYRDLSVQDLFRVGQKPAISWYRIAAYVSSALDMVLIAFATFFASSMVIASITSGSFYTGYVGALIGTYLIVGLLVLFVSGLLSTFVAWSRDATAETRFLTKTCFWIALGLYVAALIFAAVRVRLALG
jgi:hypothetical protein